MYFQITSMIDEPSHQPIVLPNRYRCRDNDCSTRWADGETPERALYNFVNTYGSVDFNNPVQLMNKAIATEDMAVEWARAILNEHQENLRSGQQD